MRIQWVSRDEFVNERFHYSPGEHVQIIAPNGGGKSHLAGQLAEVTLKRYPDINYCHMMPKYKDDGVRYWMERLGLEETDIWPPKRKLFGTQPAGHIFWPKHVKGDETANIAHLHTQFDKCLSDVYYHAPSIAFADDAYLIGVRYGLAKELDRHWIEGRSNLAGLWTTLQKPSGTTGGTISSFAYNSPHHMFFGRDTDKRNLDRLSEIAVSTIDPDDLREVIKHLPVHRYGNAPVSEMLYMNRLGEMCQIGI